jgi:hypothetical protein
MSSYLENERLVENSAFRELLESVEKWAGREIGPAIAGLLVAVGSATAAVFRPMYRWLRETDWELMVNRVFPRKKDRMR